MTQYYAYLRARSETLKKHAEELLGSDRADEAAFDKIQANIYEICGTVCKVHYTRPGGGPDACRAQFEKFRAVWGAERERQLAHGNAEKAAVEDLKLEALADAAAKFEETVK